MINFFLVYYNLFMYKRLKKIRTNLGRMYLENAYINTVNITKANTTWLTKKKGTNWGI